MYISLINLWQCYQIVSSKRTLHNMGSHWSRFTRNGTNLLSFQVIFQKVSSVVMKSPRCVIWTDVCQNLTSTLLRQSRNQRGSSEEVASRDVKIGSDWPQRRQILDFWSQNVLKLTLKSPRFVPFGANLTQIGQQIRHPWWQLMRDQTRAVTVRTQIAPDWTKMGQI